MLSNESEELRPDSWLNLQLLLDSALPVGSFAHSFGLESLVQDGRLTDGAGLRAYLEGMLQHSWATSDLMIVKAVYTTKDDNYAYAYEIEKLVHLQRLGSETREGMEKIGRRLLRLAPELFPKLSFRFLQDAIRSGQCYGSYPLIYAVLCHRLHIPLDRSAEGYLYSSVSTSVNAAQRLISMGQTEAQRLIASLFREITQSWGTVREMDPSEAYNGMPLSEIAMIRHEGLYSRLFMS